MESNLSTVEQLPTARNLVSGGFIREGSGLLIDTPLHISHSELGDAIRFDVDVQCSPLRAKQLVSLLVKIAPNERFGGQALQGIIGDWDVVDQAERSGAAEYSKELVTLHEHLGTAWAEFMRSRPGLLHVLTDTYIEPFRFLKKDSPSGAKPVNKVTRYELLAKAGNNPIPPPNSINNIVEVLEGLGAVDPEALVLESLHEQANARKTKKQQIHRPETLTRRFNSWSRSRKQSFFAHTLNTVDSEELDERAAKILEEHFDKYVAEDGTEYAYPLDRYPKSLQDAYDNNRERVLDGSYEGVRVEVPDVRGFYEEFVISSSVTRTIPQVGALPLLSWVKDKNGNRHFVFDRATEITEDQFVYKDGVLSVLAVASFAPEVRKDWPKYMKIRGSRDQFIGSAQVPVLALMRQSQLLGSRFVQEAEKHAA